MAKSPEISHFFNLHDGSLGRHVNAASSKSLEIDDDESDDDDDEIQAVLYRKTKHPFEAKICVKMSFQLL